MCGAPLAINRILQDVPKNVLLSDNKYGKLYFFIAILIIAGFGYSIISFIVKFQKALDRESESNITYQLIKKRADLSGIVKN
jgi:hypothetical protein